MIDEDKLRSVESAELVSMARVVIRAPQDFDLDDVALVDEEYRRRIAALEARHSAGDEMGARAYQALHGLKLAYPFIHRELKRRLHLRDKEAAGADA